MRRRRRTSKEIAPIAAALEVTPDQIERFLKQATKVLKDKYEQPLAVLAETYIKVTRVIPIEFPQLEDALGFPGWPLSVLIEIRGRPSSGKTTFVKWLGAQGQRHGVVTNFQDTEHSGIQEFDQGIGFDPTRAIGSKPNTFEEVFDKLDVGLATGIKLGIPCLGILDSVAATLTQEDWEHGYDEEGRRARRAAFLSQNLPRLMRLLSSDTGLVFVNQVRQNQDRRGGYGPKWTSPGGMAMEHFCHMRIEMSNVGQIKEAGQAVGMWARMRVFKSKISPPHKTATLAIYFDPPRVVGADRKGRTPMVLRDPEDEAPADD